MSLLEIEPDLNRTTDNRRVWKEKVRGQSYEGTPGEF
jgi:hypothetical protein